MGGQSSTTQTQQSSTSPWATGQGVVNSIIPQLTGQLGNSGLNPAESGAISGITNVAAGGNPYAPQIGANATGLLNGGGATAQAPNVEQNYQQYYNATNPLASNTNYDPMSTPGIGAQLTALNNSITQNINGQFAAAGRDGSGANAYALASGLAAGEAPVLTNQYNANVANQQGAASNLYGAGNTNAGILSGLQQQYEANTQLGTQAATDALNAQLQPYQTQLQAGQLAQSIPAQNLGLLAQIGIPIAGLGTQSSGSGTTTNNPSLLSQIQGWGGLFSAPANATSAASGAAQAGSGLLSGLTGLLAL
jgi:hypothetical protein